MRVRAAALFALVVHLSAACAAAQAEPAVEPRVRLDTPSGHPVPRFVSLKSAETNCRIGPSFGHPVRFVFKRAGAPVLVIAESVDHWRKIRDAVGDECWVHQTTLRAQTHVLLTGNASMLSRPARESERRGVIGAGALAKLLRQREEWLLVSSGAAKGWIAAEKVWGVDAALQARAARN